MSQARCHFKPRACRHKNENKQECTDLATISIPSVNFFSSSRRVQPFDSSTSERSFSQLLLVKYSLKHSIARLKNVYIVKLKSS